MRGAVAVQAVKAADLVLIPCRPQAFDLHAMKTTADLTNLTQRPVFVVFNGHQPQATAMLTQVQEIVGSLGLKVSPIALSERAVYRHATGAGRAVMELEPIGKAALEVEALWEWVRRQIGTKATAQTKAA
jgi:chromosome partitioning protein